MVLNKDDLLAAIDMEIEDRSSCDEDHGDELLDLQSLRRAVEAETSLEYVHYEWLSYLVANWREAALREELE